MFGLVVRNNNPFCYSLIKKGFPCVIYCLSFLCPHYKRLQFSNSRHSLARKSISIKQAQNAPEVIAFASMRCCRQKQHIRDGIAQYLRHLKTPNLRSTPTNFMALVNNQKIKFSIQNMLNPVPVIFFNPLTAPALPGLNRFKRIHRNNKLVMLTPDIYFVVRFKFGESTGKGIDIFGIVNVEGFVEVLLQFIAPLLHGRKRHNNQRSFHNSPELQLFKSQAGLDGLSHANLVSQQKAQVIAAHNLFKSKDLMRQGNNVALVRCKDLLGMYLITDTRSHCLKNQFRERYLRCIFMHLFCRYINNLPGC